MPEVDDSSVLGFSLMKTQLLTLTTELLIKRGYNLAFWGLFFKQKRRMCDPCKNVENIAHGLWIASR